MTRNITTFKVDSEKDSGREGGEGPGGSSRQRAQQVRGGGPNEAA